MVSYKKLYLEMQKQLKELQSNCIPIILDTKLWQLSYDQENKKMLIDRKNLPKR